MTNELVLERRSNLVMPTHYVELDEEEMCYVTGGGVAEAIGWITKAGILVAGFVGVASKWAKAVGFFAGLTVKAVAWGASVAMATGTFVGPGIVVALAAMLTAAAVIVPIVGLAAIGYFDELGNCFRMAGRELGLDV